MAFTVTRSVAAPPEVTWAAVSDLARHTDHVPLTQVRTEPEGTTLGSEVVARTAVGPVGFDDRMLVSAWEPPHRLRVVKTGRVLAGWAEIRVRPQGAGSVVTWTEELWVRPARPLTRGLGDLAGARLFAGVLDRLLRGLR